MVKKILALGNPVYDTIVTPEVRNYQRVLSGCSTNACLAVTKLGESAKLIGTVGQDYRMKLKKDLIEKGIDSCLFPSEQTGGFHLIYDEKGNRELSILGVANEIPQDIEGCYDDVDFILLGPILGEITYSLVKNLDRNKNIPMLLDPQGLLRKSVGNTVIHEKTKAFNEIARLCSIVKANERETKVVTGIEPRSDPIAAVKSLRNCGCNIAIVTLADAGSIIYDGERFYEISPYTTKAIDPTGAGDTYAGAFMVKYLEGYKSLTEVGCFASAVASIMVENSGPDFPLSREQANARMNILLSQPQKLLV